MKTFWRAGGGIVVEAVVMTVWLLYGQEWAGNFFLVYCWLLIALSSIAVALVWCGKARIERMQGWCRWVNGAWWVVRSFILIGVGNIVTGAVLLLVWAWAHVVFKSADKREEAAEAAEAAVRVAKEA